MQKKAEAFRQGFAAYSILAQEQSWEVAWGSEYSRKKARFDD